MNKGNLPVVREVVGVFVEAEQLRQAVVRLRSAGFSRDQIGLLATEHSVRDSLSEFYNHTNTTYDSGQAPVTAFIDKRQGDTEQESFGGSLFFVGTSGAMGAVVASSAVFGGALLAALSGVVAVGLIGAVAGKIIHQSEADYLQKHVDEGHILLFVRVTELVREKDILAVVNEYSAEPARVYEVKGSESEAAS